MPRSGQLFRHRLTQGQRRLDLGLIPETAVPVLTEIRKHNPLLFDFVLTRHLAFKGKRFAKSVFETRRFFEKKSA